MDWHGVDVNEWLFSASIEVLCVSVYVYLIHVCMSEKRSEGKVLAFFYIFVRTLMSVCVLTGNGCSSIFFFFFLLASVFSCYNNSGWFLHPYVQRMYVKTLFFQHTLTHQVC